MPTVKAPDGREMFTSFEPESEYHGGPGSGKVVRKFHCGMYFEGNYADDHENGFGLLRMSDGSTYEGEFKDGKFHGEGTHVAKCGTVYTGQYVNGLREGHGTLTLAANHLGKRVYTGAFLGNQRHGWGLFSVENPSCGGPAIYEGMWVRDKQTGKGYMVGAASPGCLDLDGAATIDMSRFVDGRKVGEGVRWCDTRTRPVDEHGSPASEYRDPTGQRVRLPDGGLYYGPWRLKDGKEVANIDAAAAKQIAKSLGLVANCSFPFTPLGADPCPEGAAADEPEEAAEPAP